MNRVEFHYNVSDKFGYLLRLLQKILERELRVVVTCPSEQLAALDQRLWTEPAHGFVPHCQIGAPATTLEASPIWLAPALPPHVHAYRHVHPPTRVLSWRPPWRRACARLPLLTSTSWQISPPRSAQNSFSKRLRKRSPVRVRENDS